MNAFVIEKIYEKKFDTVHIFGLTDKWKPDID